MQDVIEVPEVTAADMAFPTRYRELLPKWEALTKDEQAMRGPFCDVVRVFFFKGGNPADYLVPKTGVEMARVHRYLRATLGDFGPKHEHKIGGIAHMLAKWCDVKDAA